MEVSRDTLLGSDREVLRDLLQVFILRNGLGQTLAWIKSVSDPSQPLKDLANELQQGVQNALSLGDKELLSVLQNESSAVHLRATVAAIETLGKGVS